MKAAGIDSAPGIAMQVVCSAPERKPQVPRIHIHRGLPFSLHSDSEKMPGLALAIGNFDGLHRGHLALLARLTELARTHDLAPAVLSFEPLPRELFDAAGAPARLSTLRDKAALLHAAGISCWSIARFTPALARCAPEDFVRDVLRAQLDTRIVLVGDDFRFGHRRAGSPDTLRAGGIAVEVFPTFATQSMPPVPAVGTSSGSAAQRVPPGTAQGMRISSTAVRQALAAGDLATACRLLGRAYTISGRVVHGKALGRALGFPTANLRLPWQRVPLVGIFATRVRIAGDARVWMGAASLGQRPTVDHSGHYWLEVFLLDFRGDLYGRVLSVEFLHKLRDERVFDGLHALTCQIASDVAEVRNFFARLPEQSEGLE